MAEKIDTARDEIYRFINSDPAIKDPTHITVGVRKAGFMKKKELHLVGRVANQLEKKRIDEIISNHDHGFPVIDELRIRD